MKLYSGQINELKAFSRAFANTRREMFISLMGLFVVTFVLSLLFYMAECSAQPEVFDSYWSCFVWAYSRYIEGGDGVFDGGPVTVVGRTIAFLLGVIGIAIVAIPAGLIGSGFMDAIAEEKREKELEGFHRKMLRAFSAGTGRSLRNYVEKLPKNEDAWYQGCNFGHITDNVSVSKFLLKGMELKDIIDVCKKYPEFRVKNEASAISIEDGKEDRFLLEHFPVNRRYGFFANRGSKVTIVSTSSQSELCTGNFSYYLAKFAGFNYISKDFNVADGESYYNNHWNEPFYEGLTLQERIDSGEKVSKDIRKIYEDKKSLRDEFLHDLVSLCKDEDSWVICILNHIPNQVNKDDIHVAHTLADGTSSTILHNKKKYNELLEALQKSMGDEMQLVVKETTNYPLIKRGTYRNIGYKIHDDGCKCNVLTLRVSANLMQFDVRKRVAEFLMAKTIHEILEPEHRLLPDEIKDMNRSSRFKGFADQEVESLKKRLFEQE